jgi:hypothetical protein
MRKNNVLREYAYFDRRKVEDFLSTLEDGLSNQYSELKSEEGGSTKPKFAAKANVALIGEVEASIDRDSGRKIISREELRTSTDASLFQRLYEHLGREKMIRYLDCIDEDTWGEIECKEILEIKGEAELPALERMFDNLASTFTRIVDYGLISPDSEQKKALNYIKMLQDQTQTKGTKIKFKLKGDPKFKFVATLFPDKMVVTKQELEGEYTMLCKVRKKLGEDEKFQIFDVMPGGIKMESGKLRKGLEGVEQLSALMDIKGDVKEVEIEGPLIIVTPIAIYRE